MIYHFIQYNGHVKSTTQIVLKNNEDAWHYGKQLLEGCPDAAEATCEEDNEKITVRVMSKEQMLYKIQSI